MKITVKDCLSLKAFTPSILAAGKKYVENRIRSVSVMDQETASEAVQENGVREQLVLTSFSGLAKKPKVRKEIDEQLAVTKDEYGSHAAWV